VRDFRIVVAAHGELARALLSTAELICGRIDDAVAVGLDPSDSPETFFDRLMAAAGDPDQPILILSDLAGGTPHNMACVASRRLPRAVCLSGINLAILIEAATSIETLDGPSVERLVASGREALVDATKVLSTRSP
jgi:mannose/fructose-specific phosphotransferase system component IIA